MVYSPNKYRETEGIKVRRYGFALDEATLKQLAYKKGITQSIETMTQAQKAQLRYIAILEQAGNIGVLGDMSRTIDNSANQLRIFTARVQQFVRAVGNALVPMISAVLPYFTAFVQLLTEAAQSIANFMGFELPRIDLNASPVKNGYDEITAATDAATAATEKFKGTLAGVDQLNIIGSKTESGTGDGTGLNYDLNLDLPSYDFLNGVESKTKEIFEGIKKLAQEALPWVEAVGGAFVAFFASGKIALVISAAKEAGGLINALVIKFGTALPIMTAVAGAFANLALFGNSLKNLIKGTGNLTNNILQLTAGLVLTVGMIGKFIAVGNPVGAVIVGIGAALGVVLGVISGINEKAEANAVRRITEAFERGETPINEYADALQAVSENMTKTEDKFLAGADSLKTIQDRAIDSSNTISELMDSLRGAGALTEEEIGKMKRAFEDLATASSEYIEKSNENFKLYILANQDMLKAQGFSVSSMVEIINGGTENVLSEIESLKSRAEELMNIQTNIGLDSAQMSELANIQTRLLNMSGIEVGTNAQAIESKNIIESLTSVKFVDAETTAEAMDKVFGSVADTLSTFERTRAELLQSVEVSGASESERAILAQAANSLINAKQQEYIDTISQSLKVLFANTEAFGADISAAISRKITDSNIADSAFWEVYLSGLVGGNRTFEQIVEERVDERLGESARFVINPDNTLKQYFAEYGLGEEISEAVIRSVTQSYEDGSYGNVKSSYDVSGVDYSAALRPSPDFSGGWERSALSSEKETVIHLYNDLHTTVEVDSDVLGETQTKYQKIAAFTNNGR